jgi:hypothetical protein
MTEHTFNNIVIIMVAVMFFGTPIVLIIYNKYKNLKIK